MRSGVRAAVATITFEQVTKRYEAGAAPALAGLDLHAAEGEFLVLVGPSGCGKSTALRIVAGLEAPSGGRLLIDGRLANALAPRERDIAMVFQSYALYPHLNVAANIGFGLRVRGIQASEVARKVREVAAALELTDYLARKPAQLSGGQRQRVAMARALVRSPGAFLMDEPLSNLDARLRGQMRGEIAALQKRTGTTTLYVTHDQVEAMTMGTRVAVLNRGALQQVGPPRTLYDRPANLFVAGFIGSPAMNLLPGAIEDGAPAIRLGPHRLPLPDGASRLPAGRSVVVGVRPEALRPAREGEADALTGRIRFVEDLGATLVASVDLEGGVRPLGAAGVEGEDGFATARVPLRVVLDGTAVVRAGELLRLAADPARLHLFDAGTGLALGDQ